MTKSSKNPEDQSFRLADGRILSYAEYGDINGKPLFYFHGWPSSRFSGRQLNTLGKKLGLRIISPDRPGMGNSTYQPNRKLLDWPGDVEQLANYLKIKKFSVVGSSGGGPYVLACAYKIPERLINIAVVAGLGPVNKIKEMKEINKLLSLYIQFGAKFIILMKPYVSLNRFLMFHYARVQLWLTKNYYSPSDQGFWRDPHAIETFRDSMEESLRPGAKGPAWEWVIYTRPWDFDLKDIKRKIFLWHGDKDRNVPLPMAKYVAKNLPNVSAKFLPGAGHALIWSHGEEITGKLLS